MGTLLVPPTLSTDYLSTALLATALIKCLSNIPKQGIPKLGASLMDDAAALRGWVTTGSHSTSLLHEYNYLPRPHKVIRPIYTRGQMCKRPVKLCLSD